MRACAVWLRHQYCGRKPAPQVPSEKTMSIVLYVVLQLLANFNSS